MRTEQQALRTSLLGILVVAALGIGFGIVSGSTAILFDGVFSLVDAVMSVASIVLAGLIAKSASRSHTRRTHDRFTMGFWHFEPILLAVNSLLLISVASYALLQAITALLSGGREVEFGPAAIYAAIVVVLTATIGIAEHRANRRIGSALVALDVKAWLMAGGVTGALLIAFLIGIVIRGTQAQWLLPYVDPAVLTLVALFLLPMPLPTLRRAVREIALVTPPELKARAESIARDVVEREGWATHRIYAAQQGRARTVDVIFHVPAELPARPLAQWDLIRDDVREQLAGDDPHSWITVSFTSHAPPTSKIS